MKRKIAKPKNDLRPEYDFDYSKAARGKYGKKLVKGSNVVVLEKDVAKIFRNSESVNKALRSIISDSRPSRSAGKR